MNIGYAEIFMERLIELLSPQSGIADLDFWIEVTLFGGQHSAAPIDLNATAFEHKIFAVGLGIKKLFAEEFGRPFGIAAVLLPVRILGPRIKMKMNDAGFGCPILVADENRTTVSHPTTIGRPWKELHLLEVDTSSREHPPSRLFFGGRIYQQPHDFSRRNLPHHFAIDPLDGS